MNHIEVVKTIPTDQSFVQPLMMWFNLKPTIFFTFEGRTLNRRVEFTPIR